MIKPYHAETNIYEHGIAVEDGDPPESLKLIATTKLPIYSGFTLSIVDFEEHSLNERAVQLVKVKGPHRRADYYEEGDLRYCVRATLYHLNRLVDLYVRLTQIFERKHPPGTAIRGNTGDPRVFYEIDAFLGAARRVYESIKDVLWKHYHCPNATGKWPSIRRVFKSPHEIPPLFISKLDHSWSTFGEKLADYRNCVAHYDPLNDGGTTCWMNWHGNRWGMTIKLPANPDKKSRRTFDFESGPEALSYCHSMACHLVELCEALETQQKVASYLANTERATLHNG